MALTLREVCGLTTEEIARAYLIHAPTVAQRIVRAKAKIRDAQIPYRVPEADELTMRMASVLRVLYLVFNEGYSPSPGALVTRADLSREAIRLTRLIATVLSPPPLVEIHGLLALMLLNESRRAARTDGAGHLLPLEEQDRTLWNAGLIAEGCALVEKAFAHGFARARCGDRGHDYFVAYSCKGRRVCPSCNTRRMVETAAHLTDHVLPRLPVRQWVLSVPTRPVGSMRLPWSRFRLICVAASCAPLSGVQLCLDSRALRVAGDL